MKLLKTEVKTNPIICARRLKFNEFMQVCGLPQLTVHSVRYIYATKLYLKGVPKDAIKDILGVDERTLKYYIKERARGWFIFHFLYILNVVYLCVYSY